MNKTWILAVIATLAMVGCREDDPGPADPLLGTLAGTWARCYDEGQGDQFETRTISGNSVRGDLYSHTTYGGLCGDTGVLESSDVGTFVLGGEVAATFSVAGTSVMAREIDVSLDGWDTFYTIVYVDTAADPDVFYGGESFGDPSHDGTTTATRHAVLDDVRPMLRQ